MSLGRSGTSLTDCYCFRVLNLIGKNNDTTALMLEDDVDMEFDLEKLWKNLVPHLPLNWDTAYVPLSLFSF